MSFNPCESPTSSSASSIVVTTQLRKHGKHMAKRTCGAPRTCCPCGHPSGGYSQLAKSAIVVVELPKM